MHRDVPRLLPHMQSMNATSVTQWTEKFNVQASDIMHLCEGKQILNENSLMCLCIPGKSKSNKIVFTAGAKLCAYFSVGSSAASGFQTWKI